MHEKQDILSVLGSNVSPVHKFCKDSYTSVILPGMYITLLTILRLILYFKDLKLLIIQSYVFSAHFYFAN